MLHYSLIIKIFREYYLEKERNKSKKIQANKKLAQFMIQKHLFLEKSGVLGRFRI